LDFFAEDLVVFAGFFSALLLEAFDDFVAMVTFTPFLKGHGL